MINPAKRFPYDKLSIDERILLVEDIWDSIVAEEESVPLTDSQRELLDERLAKYEANPDDVLTWDEVMQEVRARLAKSRSER